MADKQHDSRGIYWNGHSWCLDFTTIDGNRHRFSLRTKDRKQAERLAWKERERIQLEEKELIDPIISVRQLLQRRREVESVRLRPRTLVIYDRACESFNALFGDLQASDLRETHIDEWIAHRSKEGAGRVTMRMELEGIRAAFNWAKKRRMIFDHRIPSPYEVLPRPTQKQIVHLEADECDVLLEEAFSPIEGGNGATRERQFPIGPMIATAIYAGLRLSEILYLDREDVDLEKRLLSVRAKPDEGFCPKTNKERTVPIFRPLLAVLEEHITEKQTGPLFRTSTGKRILPSNASRSLRKVGKNVGLGDKLGGKWNILRHTFASRLVASGMSIFKVSKLLGHASVKTTQKHYAHLAPSQLHAEGDRAFGAEPEEEETPEPKPPTEQSQGEGNAKIIQFPGFGQAG